MLMKKKSGKPHKQNQNQNKKCIYKLYKYLKLYINLDMAREYSHMQYKYATYINFSVEIVLCGEEDNTRRGPQQQMQWLFHKRKKQNKT